MKILSILFVILYCLTTVVIAKVGQPPYSLPGTTERVSVNDSQEQANGESLQPSISADGRFVVFYSEASNLVPDDYNGTGDVFLYDRQIDAIQRITGAWGGGLGVISANGRYVVFASADPALVPNDTNGQIDIFLYDRLSGTYERANVSSTGQEADGHSSIPVVSADGRYVVFRSAATNLTETSTAGLAQVFIRDRQANVTEMVSINSFGETGLGAYGYFSVSGDGRYVVFASSASNLVLDDTNDKDDIFLRDRQTNTTTRITIGPDGQEGNDDGLFSSMSSNGGHIVYISRADNLVANDTNNRPDAFIYTLWSHTTEIAGVGWDGAQPVEGSGGVVSVSANGRYVTFASADSNLVISDTNELGDIFRRDRQLQITERINITHDGLEANDYSGSAYIAAYGDHIVFESHADNLVPGDTNEFYDIFARERPPLALTGNHLDGAPGSTFTIAGGGFPLTETATISVNGINLGSLPTDGGGNFTFLLTSANADPGAYFVTAETVPYRATFLLIIDPTAPIRSPEGSGPIFDIPIGIALQLDFLPVMFR